jgi:CBS domain-containing protein
MEAFTNFGGESRPRRMLVVDADGGVVAMLSAGRLFEYLGEVDPSIRVTRTIDGTDSRPGTGSKDVDVFDVTVGALRVGSSPVLTVPDTMPVIEAIRLMYHHKRTIVALVDRGTKALTGSISSSDVKRVVQVMLRKFPNFESVYHIYRKFPSIYMLVNLELITR